MTDIIDRLFDAITGDDDAPDAVAVAGSPLAGPPLTTIPDVIVRMEAIQEWVEARAERGQHDGIAAFNFLYTIITRRVNEWVERGEFADAAFLTELDVVFANRYFDALRALAADPDSAPRSWDALFDNRSERGVAPLQFAVAGVNAHVNFDLPHAVVATCENLGLELGAGTQRADYEKINRIFALEMEDLRQHFQNRFERWIDENVLAHVFNVLGNWKVDKARDFAWESAEILWDIRRNGTAERLYTRTLDTSVGLIGRQLLVHLP